MLRKPRGKGKLNKAFQNQNNGLKNRIFFEVGYVEEYQLYVAGDYDNIVIKKYESFLHLIKMIFVQGFVDANAKSKNPRRRRGREANEKFFKKDNEYLNCYCRLIDVNPNYMLKLYKKIKYSHDRKNCLIDTLNMKKISKITKNRKKYQEMS